MRIITIDSGSRGNCYLIESEFNKYISLDAGVSWKGVQIACGFQTSKINACLISHEHG